MPNNQIQPGHEDIQRGHHVFPARHTNTVIGDNALTGTSQGQGQGQSQSQGQGQSQSQGQGQSQSQGQGQSQSQGQGQSQSQGQGQSQSQGQGGQGGQFPTEDVILGVDVNVPYDQNVAGDPQDTLWDHMANAVRPDLTPNKNKGDGVLGSKPGDQQSS